MARKKGIIEENNITSEKIKSIDKKTKDNSSLTEEIKPENKKMMIYILKVKIIKNINYPKLIFYLMKNLKMLFLL